MEALKIVGQGLVIITVILCLVPAGLGLLYAAFADAAAEIGRDIRAIIIKGKIRATMARYAKRFGGLS